MLSFDPTTSTWPHIPAILPPVLVLRFEAEDEKSLAEIRTEVEGKLEELTS